MLSHKKSLSILRKTNELLYGHFVLSSGLHSSNYVQCAKLLSFPHIATTICKSLAKKIKNNFKKFDLKYEENSKVLHIVYIEKSEVLMIKQNDHLEEH